MAGRLEAIVGGMLILIGCGKASDGVAPATGTLSDDSVSDAAASNDPDASIGDPGSGDPGAGGSGSDNPGTGDAEAGTAGAGTDEPPFGTPGTGIVPTSMFLDGSNIVVDAPDASAEPQCPSKAEELEVAIGAETYVLDPHLTENSTQESSITRGCGGISIEFKACNLDRTVCTHVYDTADADGELRLIANLKVEGEDNWGAFVDREDLGETFWCQQDGQLQAWVDFSFTVDAIQEIDGPTVPMRITLKAFLPGRECQYIEP
jgi:hypothetical protein